MPSASRSVIAFDDGRTVDVPVREVPEDCRAEGAVLDVPQDARGAPLWREARRNTAEEQARREKAEAVLKELRMRDPGGDIEL